MKDCFSPRRRSALAAGLALAALSLPGARAQAPWPARPIVLLTGFAAGGTTDAIARIVANDMSARLGQTIVVDSRAGAGGTIAAAAVQRAEPDGYLLILMPNPTVNFFHFQKKNIDFLKDFSPVAQVYTQYNVLLINPAVAPFQDIRSLPQLIALAKAQDGGLNYASTGTGSLGHLTMERICAVAGVSMQHISYKGAAPAITDMLAGQVGILFADSLTALPHVRSGKLRPIAVSTAQRQADMPDVPTMDEQGLQGLSGGPYGGIFAPPKTPKTIVDRLSEEVRETLSKPEVREKLRLAGTAAAYATPDALGAFVNSESRTWGRVIVERGIRAE